jgi:hypothetical protein
MWVIVNEKNNKMGDHYIPKYYLKGFLTDPSSDLLFVYRKGDKTPFKSSINNIAHQNDFYSREIESYLANEIEDPANQVLKKVREQKIITSDEKHCLAKYLMVLWKRVPLQKDMIIEKMPEMMDSLISQYETEFIELGQYHPHKKDIVERRISELREFQEKNQNEDFSKEIWLGTLPIDKTTKPVDVFCKMTWRFLIPKNNELFFLTCDNPLFFFPRMGIGKRKSEVSFPINSRLALWATWRIDLQEGFYPCRSQIVKEINRRTIFRAKDFIYSAYEKNWIQTLVNKEKLNINLIT